jgi:hypothetical protein
MAMIKIHDPKKPGDYLVIASGDFHPDQHVRFEDVAEAPAAPEAPPTLTAAEVVTAIKAADFDALQAITATENAREGGARKTVLAAITARFDQLTAAE